MVSKKFLIIFLVSNLSMLYWFGQLKYFFPPEMSGPLIYAVLFQSKMIAEAIGITVKKNILRRKVGSSLRTLAH